MAALTLFILPALGQTRFDPERPLTECSTTVGSDGETSIIASDNESLFIRNRSGVAAVSAKTLGAIWLTSLPDGSSPAGLLIGASLYLLNITESDTQLISVNTETGLVRSRVANLPFPASDSPKLAAAGDGTIIVFDASGKVAVYNDSLSAVAWFRDFGTPITAVQARGGTITFLSGAKLFSLNSTNGASTGELPLPEAAGVLTSATAGFWITGSVSGTLRAVRPKGDGWSLRTGGKITSLTTDGSRVLATSYDNFAYLFVAGSGKLVWKKRIGGRILFDPLIIGRTAVIADSFDGIALILDLKDGRSMNRLSLSPGVSFTGSPRLVGDRLFFSTTRGIRGFVPDSCK